MNIIKLIEGIKARGKNAHFIEDRNNLLAALKPELKEGTVLLLMGARDPSLETFCKGLFEEL